MSDPSIPNPDSNVFRYLLGGIVILGGLAALGGLYWIVVPEGNKEPLLLAIGIVLGWGGNVVASEYGSSTTGRKIAEATVRGIESQTNLNTEASNATGKHPLPVETRADAAADHGSKLPIADAPDLAPPVAGAPEEPTW